MKLDYLRIKIASLAAEARIIRKAELRIKKRLHKRNLTISAPDT